MFSGKEKFLENIVLLTTYKLNKNFLDIFNCSDKKIEIVDPDKRGYGSTYITLDFPHMVLYQSSLKIEKDKVQVLKSSSKYMSKFFPMVLDVDYLSDLYYDFIASSIEIEESKEE